MGRKLKHVKNWKELNMSKEDDFVSLKHFQENFNRNAKAVALLMKAYVLLGNVGAGEDQQVSKLYSDIEAYLLENGHIGKGK